MDGCGRKHTKFIHINEPVDSGNETKQVGSDSIKARDTEVSDATVVNVSTSIGVNVHMPVVEVRVNDQCNTYALLETASTSSFCSQKLVDNFQLNTLSQSQSDKTSQIVDLNLISPNNGEALRLTGVYVVEDIPFKTSSVDVENYPHLQDIPLNINNDSTVQILIGQDNAEALIPLETRRGKKGDPFAVRTLFGWSMNGPIAVRDKINQKVISHFVTTFPARESVEKLWEIENEGIKKDDTVWSQEDRKVIELWDRECKLINGHYVILIPWRNKEELVPNNISVAMYRLKSLNKILIKRGLRDRYNEEIMKLVQNGYAEKIPLDEIQNSGRIWYLPHHAVVTEKKPDKVRIVFDCASKYQGKSLDDRCLQGPDFNNKLLYVILRFRQHEDAIMADIESMYHQVKISRG